MLFSRLTTGAVLLATVCLLHTARSAHWSGKEKRPTQKGLCPETNDWTQGAHSCYRFVESPVQWIMAEYLCREYFHDDAIPVKITSQEENDFVWKLVGDRDVWIGLQDISHPDRDIGVWQWSDGTNITRRMYKNWYPGAPNGGGESCAQFWEGGEGTWEDTHCREEYPFICELDIDECARGLDRCSRQALCENTDDGYECTCAIGYTGDGFTCEREKPGQYSDKKKAQTEKPKKPPKRSYKDVDKCVKGMNKCAPQAICENVGDSYRCTCALGYVGDGFTCERETPEHRQQRKVKAEQKVKQHKAVGQPKTEGQPKEGQPKEDGQPKEGQRKEDGQPKEETASGMNTEEVEKENKEKAKDEL